MKLKLKSVLNTSGFGQILNQKLNILRIRISKEQNMFVAERFLCNVIKEYVEHPVSTNGGTWYP